MADFEETAAVLKEAKRLGLYGVDEVSAHPLACLSADYNGIGPASFPERLRKFVDDLTPDLKPAALVHDFRWSHSDGSLEGFDYSNTELEMNCLKIAQTFPWWHWKRYYLERIGRTYAALCREFGYIPYIKAFKEQKKEA